MMKLWVALVIGTLVCGTVSLLPDPSDAAPAATARTSDAGGVKVVVTPKVMNPTARVWEFEIVIDTHTKPLNEDLAKVAVLVDEAGRQYMPETWQGDGPGGHHRKGILRFTAPTKMPFAVELQISDIGGTAIRTFRWELK
jgi:hypothetical protein